MNNKNPEPSARDATEKPSEGTPTAETALKRIGEALEGLRYGSVLTIVQDGVVVQIERTEKTRLARP